MRQPYAARGRGDGYKPSPDVLLLSAVLVLAVLGALNLVAIGQQGLALHQAVAILIGFLLLGVTRRVPNRGWPWLGRSVYAAALFMLLAIAAVGASANGARRWLVVSTVVLQPSELAKLGLLLVLANLLGNSELTQRRRTIIALALAAAPIALTVAEPDLSTSALLVVVVLATLVLGRVRPSVLLALLVAGGALAPLGEHLLRPYQAARLNAFLHGSADIHAAGWSTLQAHIAVASGGLFGLLRSPTHQLLAQYLPARETDLAFASLVEQGGLLVGLAAVIAVVVLVWRLVATAVIARTAGGALMAGGLAVLLGSEAAISVAGNLGVSPLAGVPFPFLSFGGTSAAVHLAAFGLVLGARGDAYRRRLWRPSWRLRRAPRLVRVTALGLAATLAGLAAFAWHMQQAEGAALRQDGLGEMTRCVWLPAPRGVIEDRHGVIVATDASSDQVSVIPQLVRQDPLELSRLASVLNTTVSTLQHTVAAGGNALLVSVAETSAAVGDRVAAADFRGVVVTGSPRRVYPFGPLLAPILGFVGVATPEDIQEIGPLPPGEIVGRAGLEREYDWVLRGRDGYQCVFAGPRGNAVAMAEYRPPVPGGDLRLSIDVGLQQAAAAALQTALRGVPGQPRGDQGAALVLDPRSGELLAMASQPAYDDNLFGPPVDDVALQRTMVAPGLPLLEHATQTLAPPGSTYKLVVASADAVYGAIPPSQVIPTGYIFSLGTTTFHGWTWLPPQDLSQAVALSNDVYFYKLALALGPDRISQVASTLGVGQPSGIDLPGESPGFLGTPESVRQLGGTWYAGSTVILGIGQGYLAVTPLQVARWTGAIATGDLVTPRFGLATRWSTGEDFFALPAVAPAPLPFADRLAPVREGMRMAVLWGTATQLQGLPVAAGGKTGTAEDPSSSGGNPDAWFTAVAPIDHPAVVVTVMVRSGGEGFYTAEPAVVQILRSYLSRRDITARLPMEQGQPSRPLAGRVR